MTGRLNLTVGWVMMPLMLWCLGGWGGWCELSSKEVAMLCTASRRLLYRDLGLKKWDFAMDGRVEKTE